MVVAENILCIWSGTNASIPTGWSRDTDFDGKYVLGADAAGDGGGTGGSATHTHTVSDHNHTEGAHTHTFTASASGAVGTGASGTQYVANINHTHASQTSASATATLNTATITLDGASNDPPYYEIIFIKSSGTHDIPDDGLVLFDNSSVPAGWQFCNGDNSSPDLRNKFLKGAAASGDSGSTGGASTHTHTNTAHVHTHNAHGHALTTSLNSSAGSRIIASGTGMASHAHTHDVTLNSVAEANTSSVSAVPDTTNAEPTYKKLLAIQNQTGGYATTNNMICFWKSTAASIPTNWARYTNMDTYFFKNANDTTEIGNTGGNSVHTHTDAAGHTHTNTAHQNHGVTQTGASAQRKSGTDAVDGSTAAHTHSWYIGNATPTISTDAVTIANCSSQANYPSYVKVIFIKYTAPEPPAGYYHVMVMET